MNLASRSANSPGASVYADDRSPERSGGSHPTPGRLLPDLISYPNPRNGKSAPCESHSRYETVTSSRAIGPTRFEPSYLEETLLRKRRLDEGIRGASLSTAEACAVGRTPLAGRVEDVDRPAAREE